MQICVCIFFREGDLQLNGLMIKAVIKAITWFSFLFFFSLSSSTAELNGMCAGKGCLGTEIKKYKAILTA